jgi:hypothetical protein
MEKKYLSHLGIEWKNCIILIGGQNYAKRSNSPRNINGYY